LNLFRMAGLMRGDRVKTESSGQAAPQTVLTEGVRGNPDIDAFAVRSDREVSVLAWNYHDDDLPGPDARVQLNISGVPDRARRVLLRHYRIDETHSNAWTVWKRMGSPQQPSSEQYAALESAGHLEQMDSPQSIPARGGQTKLEFTLPRQAVSLVQLSW